MKTDRRKSRPIKVGSVTVGGSSPVTVQSMTNTRTEDTEACIAQLKALETAGCDIARVTVPTPEAVKSLGMIKESGLTLPIVADIHFNYRLAIEAAAAGADKIRINPGNIGGMERVKAVADACRLHSIPIRIGVNGGSLEKNILAKYGRPSGEALAESAFYHISLLEQCDFDNIIVAVKSSSVTDMIEANRIIAARCDYPLHLGVTEAGTDSRGTLKSAIGIGSLLADGIGDTIRVSLTADPLLEVRRGREILAALGIEETGVNIISCPTCGRTSIDLIGIAERLETAVGERFAEHKFSRRYTVAVMGCAVNGPGEAREADFGIAGGRGDAVLFRHGEITGKIDERDAVKTLLAELEEAENVR